MGHFPRPSRRRDDGLYVRAAALSEIVPGRPHPVPGRPIVMVRLGGTVYAFEATCPHAGARLVTGRVVGGCLECPVHGARFDLAKGGVVRGPARRRLLVYDVRVRAGVVYVADRPRRRWRAR